MHKVWYSFNLSNPTILSTTEEFKNTNVPFYMSIQEEELQGDWKVIHPTLKYLLVAAIQFGMVGLINIQYHCDYT
jgi:hypothetical protein